MAGDINAVGRCRSSVSNLAIFEKMSILKQVNQSMFIVQDVFLKGKRAKRKQTVLKGINA